MSLLNFVMPVVAILVVLLLFTIPMVWGLFFSIALLGTVGDILAAYYLRLMNAMQQKDDRMDAKQRVLADLDVAPAVVDKGFRFAWLKLPVLIVALPLLFASGMAISFFSNFSFTNQAVQVSPPPDNPVAVTNAAATSADLDGQSLYTANCAVCHQGNGQGIAGAFPPLDGSEWVLGDPSNIAKIVIKGLAGPITVKGVTYNSVMTPFGSLLSDEQIAAVIGYVRSAWSNTADPIDINVVTQARAETSSLTSLTAENLTAP